MSLPENTKIWKTFLQKYTFPPMEERLSSIITDEDHNDPLTITLVSDFDPEQERLFPETMCKVIRKLDLSYDELQTIFKMYLKKRKHSDIFRTSFKQETLEECFLASDLQLQFAFVITGLTKSETFPNRNELFKKLLGLNLEQLKGIFITRNEEKRFSDKITASLAAVLDLKEIEGKERVDVLTFKAYDYDNLFSEQDLNPANMLFQTLRMYSQLWMEEYIPDKTQGYYAPYTCFVNGSCSGKTSTVLKLSSVVPMIYLNLRDKTSLSPPSRTEVGADLFTESKNPSDVLYFLDAIIESIKIPLAAEPQDFDQFFQLTSVPAFWRKVKDYSKEKKESTTTEELKNSSSKQEEKRTTNKTSKGVVDHGSDVASNLKSIQSRSKFPFLLIVLDEASSMLVERKSGTEGSGNSKSLFIIWRQAISFLKSAPIFFLLLDTSSRISNFQPAAIHDPSFRVRQGHLLFQPWYAFPFTGPWKLPDTSQLLMPCGNGKANLFTPVKYSRPHFRRILKKLDENASDGDKLARFDEMVNFAKIKLLLGKNPHDATASMIAVMSNKLDLIAIPVDLNDELVSFYCGTLDHVSLTRDVIKTKYVLEPMLVEGATRILQPEPTYQLHLDCIRQQIAQGLLGAAYTKGDLGELVAAIYLLRAKDMTVCIQYGKDVGVAGEQTKSVVSYSIPVISLHFIMLLLRNNKFRDKYAQLPICKSLMNFTCFRKVDGTITRNLLVQMWNRNVAIFPPTNQEAYDMAVPLVLLPGPIITVMSIQVKNYQTAMSFEDSHALCQKQCDYFRNTNIIDDSTPMIAVTFTIKSGLTKTDGPTCTVEVVKRDNEVQDIYIHIAKLPKVTGISKSTIEILQEMLLVNTQSSAQRLQNSYGKVMVENSSENPEKFGELFKLSTNYFQEYQQLMSLTQEKLPDQRKFTSLLLKGKSIAALSTGGAVPSTGTISESESSTIRTTQLTTTGQVTSGGRGGRVAGESSAPTTGPGGRGGDRVAGESSAPTTGPGGRGGDRVAGESSAPTTGPGGRGGDRVAAESSAPTTGPGGRGGDRVAAESSAPTTGPGGRGGDRVAGESSAPTTGPGGRGGDRVAAESSAPTTGPGGRGGDRVAAESSAPTTGPGGRGGGRVAAESSAPTTGPGGRGGGRGAGTTGFPGLSVNPILTESQDRTRKRSRQETERKESSEQSESESDLSPKKATKKEQK